MNLKGCLTVLGLIAVALVIVVLLNWLCAGWGRDLE